MMYKAFGSGKHSSTNLLRKEKNELMPETWAPMVSLQFLVSTHDIVHTGYMKNSQELYAYGS